MIPLDSWKGKAQDKELLKRCKEAIRQVTTDADVILYGSRARGDANEYSDYDILIIVNDSADMALEERILAKLFPLEEETCEVLTFIVYSKQDWNSPVYRVMPLHKNVDRDGVIL